MPLTEEQTRARIDAVSAAMMPLLRGAFYASKSQGKAWHTPWLFGPGNRPTDGNTASQMGLDVKYGNQTSWQETLDSIGAQGYLPADFVSDIKIDHVRFPNGKTGFAIKVLIEFSGVQKMKTFWEGPSEGDYFAHDWQEIPDEI